MSEEVLKFSQASGIAGAVLLLGKQRVVACSQHLSDAFTVTSSILSSDGSHPVPAAVVCHILYTCSGRQCATTCISPYATDMELAGAWTTRCLFEISQKVASNTCSCCFGLCTQQLESSILSTQWFTGRHRPRVPLGWPKWTQYKVHAWLLLRRGNHWGGGCAGGASQN